MLAVPNSEHDVGDDENTSSEVAKGKTRHESSSSTKSRGSAWDAASGTGKPASVFKYYWGPQVPRNCVITYFIVIFVIYSLIQIQ